jgi:cbb3-type cytochrome oxidase maturation protein
MSVIIVLILASLTVGLIFLGAFIWSVRSGQYEDTLTPSMRMLCDDVVMPNDLPKAGGDAAPRPASEETKNGR